MAEPLQLPQDTEERREQLRLGETTVELPASEAAAVRNAFEGLAQQYGAALEQFRAQQLQQIGSQQYRPPPEVPQGLDVPDPDLLFSNKGQWTDAFQQALENRIGSVRGENVQMVQGAVQAFQQELQRRDMAQAAQAKHDSAMDEMLERRGLSEHTRVVQAIYNEQFENLKHLPLELGLDKIGQLAEEEIHRIRSGEKWTMNRGPDAGVAPRPPTVLRTSRKAPSAPPPAPPPSPAGYEPNGGLGAMGRIIRERQAKVLGVRTA